MVVPLSTSPLPNGSDAPLESPVPGAGEGAVSPVAESPAADWAGTGAGADGAGGAGVQSESKPPALGGGGTESGAPVGGGGGARCVPAPPDESPGAFCVYQAGGV